MTDDPAPLPCPSGNQTEPGAGEASTRPSVPALSRTTPRSALLPALIRNDSPQASRRYLEFFAAQIRNPNTRAAYSAHGPR